MTRDEAVSDCSLGSRRSRIAVEFYSVCGSLPVVAVATVLAS